jgi:hypothetical protein
MRSKQRVVEASYEYGEFTETREHRRNTQNGSQIDWRWYFCMLSLYLSHRETSVDKSAAESSYWKLLNRIELTGKSKIVENWLNNCQYNVRANNQPGMAISHQWKRFDEMRTGATTIDHVISVFARNSLVPERRTNKFVSRNIGCLISPYPNYLLIITSQRDYYQK